MKYDLEFNFSLPTPLLFTDFFALLLVCILWAVVGRKKKNKWKEMVVQNKSHNPVHLLG